MKGAEMSEIILHHYPMSPYAEKVRLAFGLKGIAWRSVHIPIVMPKPELMPLTGGYRRTPVMQIGADIYCDTLCILREVERRFPAPSLYPSGEAGLAHAVTWWSHVLATNLSGSFFCMRAALKHFKEQRAGRLINLISTAGLIGNVGQANYAASKAGLFALTRVAALEMVRYGVTVNCVAPFAHTRMTDSIKGATPEQVAYLESGRRAKVEHILPFLAFLLSNQAEGISGQVFGVRGHEVYLFSQPRPVATIGQAGGWTAQSLRRAIDEQLRSGLTPLVTDLELFQHEPLV